jgi:alkanesulfonate monooxygenase SsuD/methylene tetrahydromethanopterin reductase-like flavin-dependent oxidoreductase (luciferase family)
MKVGVLQFFSWPRREVPLETVYARALERIQVMDSAGYDCVWLAEHHFTGYSVCPSVHMMGVHAANLTRRIRIGTGVSLAAFYHPLRLAEEVALLDVLSGGRVNWGAGRGFDPIEFDIFDVPVKESRSRFHEAVQIVQAAWGSERLTWDGAHWRFDGVEVLPKPRQDPHPPIWLAAGSESAVRWAAENAYSILLGPHATVAETGEHLDLFWQTLREAGHSAAGRDIPIARMIAVADSDEEARSVARRGAEWVAASYINQAKVTSAAHPAQQFMQLERETLLDRYVDEVVVHGSPARVRAELERLREELGLGYLLCVPLSHDSFVRFTDDVLPHLA